MAGPPPSLSNVVVPGQHYFCQIWLIFGKSNILYDFGWTHCYKMIPLYLYFEVWRVTYQGFSVWAS